MTIAFDYFRTICWDPMDKIFLTNGSGLTNIGLLFFFSMPMLGCNGTSTCGLSN